MAANRFEPRPIDPQADDVEPGSLHQGGIGLVEWRWGILWIGHQRIDIEAAQQHRPAGGVDDPAVIGSQPGERPVAHAVPMLPEMIAPAWPIRFPGGAVRPLMNPITGFPNPGPSTSSAAASSSLPPISPIRMTARVAPSVLKRASTSLNERPRIGSPPIPTEVVCPT